MSLITKLATGALRSFGILVLSATSIVVSSAAPCCAADEPIILSQTMRHLRLGTTREWDEFPATPDGDHLEITFAAQRNAEPLALSLAQEDVKQTWNVTINDAKIGQLPIDENGMVVLFEVPARTLVDVDNRLRIEPQAAKSKLVDDIRVGNIRLDACAVETLVHECHVDVEVVDAQTHERLPSRITVVDQNGRLQTTGAQGNHLAVRPGIVYSATGEARIGLPAGRYTIYAGRGFEYSVAKTELTMTAGENVRRKLTLRREVETDHYVACDTHVHTRTHSGHGDATVEERMITIAGEGVELPIATDHNVNIDHEPFARAQGVREYFTPVIGNEVTTELGHINVFPISRGARAPNQNLRDWKSIFADIYRTPGVRVAILNHGRDLHSGVRPLGPKLHNALVGENVAGWRPGMNAMEVINSAATQTATLQLTHDWMGFLNRGHTITPIGCSDSHDVGRHFVGQGRTYIRCDDRFPAEINIRDAVDSLIAGRVLVSYGLLVDMTVNGKYLCGDMARIDNASATVDLRVQGPHWVQASRVQLFANGQLIREETISSEPASSKSGTDLPPGTKWQGQWQVDALKHDVHLVAVATGPGIDQLYWATAKPYQPTSTSWTPIVMACTGAIWLDVDGDGQRTSAHTYAKQLYADCGGDVSTLLESLTSYDEAVTIQAAHLYQTSKKSWLEAPARDALRSAPERIQAAIRRYLKAWRANQLAPRG